MARHLTAGIINEIKRKILNGTAATNIFSHNIYTCSIMLACSYHGAYNCVTDA